MTNPQYPAQPGYPQGPHYPQPPRKKKVWPWVVGGILAVILLMFGGCVALIGGAANEVAKAEEKRNTAAPAGSEVRDGKFSFLVTGVEEPVTVIGTNDILKEQAQGEFIQVHVDVTNVGNEAQYYFGSNQKLIDDQGREFANDTSAEINVNDHLTEEINPGNKVSITLVFDVPQGTVPAAVEFHDSAFSGGVRVALK
ncbi:DUF4352 domain-containing protein [Nocardia sp. NPDC057663]|uniref:DUF4352 domain-containing protein n=1 Tax=Nocardia sp. NPDC057663 TaxID=3346201 RepID=UPI00366AF10D